MYSSKVTSKDLGIGPQAPTWYSSGPGTGLLRVAALEPCGRFRTMNYELQLFSYIGIPIWFVLFVLRGAADVVLNSLREREVNLFRFCGNNQQERTEHVLCSVEL